MKITLVKTTTFDLKSRHRSMLKSLFLNMGGLHWTDITSFQRTTLQDLVSFGVAYCEYEDRGGTYLITDGGRKVLDHLEDDSTIVIKL